MSSFTVPYSAGVGRTGTFITIDHILEQVKKENKIDIPGVINKQARRQGGFFVARKPPIAPILWVWLIVLTVFFSN